VASSDPLPSVQTQLDGHFGALGRCLRATVAEGGGQADVETPTQLYSALTSGASARLPNSITRLLSLHPEALSRINDMIKASRFEVKGIRELRHVQYHYSDEGAVTATAFAYTPLPCLRWNGEADGCNIGADVFSCAGRALAIALAQPEDDTGQGQQPRTATWVATYVPPPAVGALGPTKLPGVIVDCVHRPIDLKAGVHKPGRDLPRPTADSAPVDHTVDINSERYRAVVSSGARRVTFVCLGIGGTGHCQFSCCTEDGMEQHVADCSAWRSSRPIEVRGAEAAVAACATLSVVGGGAAAESWGRAAPPAQPIAEASEWTREMFGQGWALRAKQTQFRILPEVKSLLAAYFNEGVRRGAAHVKPEVALERLRYARAAGSLRCEARDIPTQQYVQSFFSRMSSEAKKPRAVKRSQGLEEGDPGDGGGGGGGGGGGSGWLGDGGGGGCYSGGCEGSE
jgi:hypothetical protein